MATTTFASGKPFTWSYSKIKNYEACPKKHWHIDIVKNVKEEESDILAWGNLVHEKMAKRLGKDKVPLPKEMEQFEHHATGIERVPGSLFVEQKYGLTKDFAGCKYFDSRVWYRGVGDVVCVYKERAIITDWKLGKVLEDSVQLALMAACVFGHFPEVKQVDTIFQWLAYDARTHEVFKRDDMPGVWAAILPRVHQYQAAVENEEFPAKPSGLCRRHCPVSVCPYYGEGSNA